MVVKDPLEGHSAQKDECASRADAEALVTAGVNIPDIPSKNGDVDIPSDLQGRGGAQVPTTRGGADPTLQGPTLQSADMNPLPWTQDDVCFLDGISDIGCDLHDGSLLLGQPECTIPEELGGIHVPEMSKTDDVVHRILCGWDTAELDAKKKQGISRSTSTGSVAMSGKGKGGSGSLDKTAAERQRRYRERKKSKQAQLASDIAVLREKANALKSENDVLKEKQEIMCSILQNFYNVNVTDDGQGFDIDALGGTGWTESVENDIGHMYLDVLHEFNGSVSGRRQDEALKSTTAQTPTDQSQQTHASLDSMYDRFLQKVDGLVKKYESCDGDPDAQESVEQDLGLLLELRTKALTDMAAKHPGMVLRHLVDGWLERILEEGALDDHPMTTGSPTLQALIHVVNLTSDQMSDFCRIWEQFASLWSKKVPKDLDRCVSKLPDNPCIQEVSTGESKESHGSGDFGMDVWNTRGMHAALEDSCYLQLVAEQELDVVSQHQLTMVHELGQKIFSILSPIQRGRFWVLQSRILKSTSREVPATCQQLDSP